MGRRETSIIENNKTEKPLSEMVRRGRIVRGGSKGNSIGRRRGGCWGMRKRGREVYRRKRSIFWKNEKKTLFFFKY